MQTNFNYKELYHKHYKNIPNYVFWTVFAVLAIGAIVAAIIYDEEEVSVAIALGGILVGAGIAALARWFSMIGLSQSVVVADTLLALKGEEAPAEAVAEDELPEL